MKSLRRYVTGALALGWAFVVMPATLLLLPNPASSTVTSSQNKVIISGNNVQTSFPFSFVGVSASDISVIFTNASGVSTTLTQGPGSTQYQVTLTAAAPGQLWGIGGTVTYNPGGTPIATGTTLTIVRTVPLTQSTSLQNQASFGQYAAATERALDQVDMQVQQIAEAQGRVISAPIVDPSSINLTLPPAAQRANTGLAFDGSGNVIAGTVPATGTISSAMAPVVNAASVSAGRTALGLGSVAVENIGGAGQGLGDDGSGNLRVQTTLFGDGTNQSVTSAFHTSVRFANASIVYTMPVSTSLFNGFWFTVNALSGTATFTPNVADNFSGMSSGASLVIPQGNQATVTTNGGGTWFINPVSSAVSLNVPLNLTISCTTASSALTCTLQDRNGNTPSTASPVLWSYQFNGQPTQRAVTGALSITVPSGATLGTVNGQTNRIWIGLFDNAGTPVLGVYNSLNSSGPSILPWDETSQASGTGITSGSTSAQTWYTTGAVTTKSFRIIGYVESTQPTAGTWSSSPSKTQLFGPGVKKPGDVVQEVAASISSGDTTASATFVALTNNRISITPLSASSLIRVDAYGSLTDSTSGAWTANLQLSRGVTAATNLFGVNQAAGPTGGATSETFPAVCMGFDIPNTTSSTTYAVQGKTSSGTLTFGGNTLLSAREIQI